MSRTAILLDQIDSLGLGDFNLTDEHLQGHGIREPFCKLCAALAQNIALSGKYLDGQTTEAVAAATAAVGRTAASEADSKNGRLDRTLMRLDHSLDPKSTAQERLLLLERLVSACQGLRLVALHQSPQDNATAAEPGEAPLDKAQPSEGDAAEVSQQLHALASLLSIDGQHQQASQLIGAINEAVQTRMRALPQSFHEPILPEGSLSSDQEQELRELQAEWSQEYKVRRQMLIERAKVLVQSFMWAEKLKDEGARAEAQAAADKFISAMSAEPEVSLQLLYSARQGDLVAIGNKATSGDKSKFGASVKQLVIGSVPDRGGRTDTAAAAAAGAEQAHGHKKFPPKSGGGHGHGQSGKGASSKKSRKH